jgi:sialate O-acetylesterase
MRLERMISRFTFAWIAAPFLLVAPLGTARAQSATQPAKPLPLVSPIFGDNMVLQRGRADAIWGWSEPGDKIQVQIGESAATAVVGADHKWQVKLQPPPAGGPYTVRIAGRETVELHNVLVGDVWLCGGQSNMQFALRGVRNGAEEVKAANYPEIRFFSVASHPAYHHTDLVDGKWAVVSPDTADRVSAVGYYFARRVQQETHVPIGLVVDALGGTPAEAWASAEALRPLKDFDVPLAELQRFSAMDVPEYGNYVMHWYDEFDTGIKQNWVADGLDDSDWMPVELPGGFSELGVGETPAVAWFRKEIVLPDPLPSGRAMLFLGPVERMDTVYINGKWVGASAWVENPRVYFIGDGVLKPGRNVVTIRVLKTKPQGGFLGKPEELHLQLGDKSSIPLAGKWKGKLSVDARPPQPLPIAYENWPVMPAVLYQGMLAPIAPLSITGALWYQGEQNSERGYQYRKILPAMIASWRKLFAQGDFPFYIVSLPAFKHRSLTPVDGDPWAETRESQAVAATIVPNSCLAVAIDTGDADNIHPQDKMPVGERLAACALANIYGERIVFAGPTLASVERLPGQIRLHFAHTEGGLLVKGTKLEEFAIAGEDRKWSWADARIEGDTIVVSSASVPNPKEVRYAWQSNPAATLFNGAGLPAVPFRTDHWPGVTEAARPY